MTGVKSVNCLTWIDRLMQTYLAMKCCPRAWSEKRRGRPPETQKGQGVWPLALGVRKRISSKTTEIMDSSAGRGSVQEELKDSRIITSSSKDLKVACERIHVSGESR